MQGTGTCNNSDSYESTHREFLREKSGRVFEEQVSKVEQGAQPRANDGSYFKRFGQIRDIITYYSFPFK